MLGASIKSALTSVGITETRVSKWLGRDCHCQERIERLNLLENWAKMTLSGKLKRARDFLSSILKE